MATTMYCWRCKIDLPILTEEEYQLVFPTSFMEQIREYREKTGADLRQAQADVGERALATYERISGFKETNPLALYHHRLSLYGPPCAECGKPLRTPAANYCAACSAPRGCSNAAR
ncbi:hypothetical protein [Variovorax sp. YR752]|uniref:hypothetical protein n=1 Tax=Variovorax sp. YR752 TaxID=1884383 RepID=UPI00313771D0